MKIKMSQEEAYRLIESCLEYDKDMSEYPERYDVALHIAREVFHKQTPMKVHGDDSCVCGHDLGLDRPVPNYCPNCGQAIDWSEE